MRSLWCEASCCLRLWIHIVLNVVPVSCMNYFRCYKAKEFISVCLISQFIQDDLLSEEIKTYSACERDQIPLPLQRLLKSIAQLTPDTLSSEKPLTLRTVTDLCMRDMYHYARVRGLHVLECIVNVALSFVRKEQIQEACQVSLIAYL